MFVNFTLDLLVHDSALSLDPDAYVIEILSEVPASSDIIDACK
jgi:c-di-GMP-related signal transduction protein